MLFSVRVSLHRKGSSVPSSRHFDTELGPWKVRFPLVLYGAGLYGYTVGLIEVDFRKLFLVDLSPDRLDGTGRTSFGICKEPLSTKGS